MSERETSAEVKGPIDLGEFMAAAAAAGVTVTMYPRELINGEPAELLGLSAVLELPAGSIASDEDMEKADYVIVGGVVVKNRNGPVYSFERGRQDVAEAEPPAGERFADPDVATAHLAQGIFSGTLRGDELRAIIENSPRLAQALCRGIDRIWTGRGEAMTYQRLMRNADRGRLTAKIVIAALVAELTKPGEEIAAEDPGLIRGPRPTIPGKFMLGQMVRFKTSDGAVIGGEVRGITHYVDRAPAYFVRPDTSGAAILGHDHDVPRDEDELEAQG